MVTIWGELLSGKYFPKFQRTKQKKKPLYLQGPGKHDEQISTDNISNNRDDAILLSHYRHSKDIHYHNSALNFCFLIKPACSTLSFTISLDSLYQRYVQMTIPFEICL